MNLSHAAALLLICVSAWAQPQSTGARDLLERVAETYRNLDSFEWTAVFTVTTDSGDFQPRPSRVVGEFRRPQMRIEFPKRQPMAWIEITDGKAVWLYYPSRRGFCRPDAKLVLQRTPHAAMWALGWVASV